MSNRVTHDREWHPMTACARVALLGLALTMGGVGGCDDEAEDPFEELELVMREDANLPPVEPFDEDAAAACGVALSTINGGRELVIRATTIVDDPVRTQWDGNPTAADSGVWHFGRLMTHMAGDQDPSDFVESWLELWVTNRVVNGQTIPSRAAMQDLVLDEWPRLGNGKLDLTQAPMRLLAIVNRVDLASTNDAGEGRFVFGVLGPGGSALPFTVILEYDLPLSTMSLQEWTNAWHELSAFAPSSSDYKTRLQALTMAFAGPDVLPSRPNGSAISQVRSNEIALDAPWELREFKLDTDGNLRQRTVALTPKGAIDGTNQLGRYINANEAQILGGTHTVPLTFEDVSFRSGGIENQIDFWSAPNIANPAARHLFSLGTCNGCHGAETGTFFLHINPREPGQMAPLSGFMTGIDVVDPDDGSTTRTFDDILRRRKRVRDILCGA